LGVWGGGYPGMWRMQWFSSLSACGMPWFPCQCYFISETIVESAGF
jgi:hypothetical protein